MKLSRTQRGVALGMAVAAILTILAYFSPWLPLTHADLDNGIRVWLACSVVAASWLMISVGRLARHRFFTAGDIDGGGTNHNSAEAMQLQALLQNTLEQTVFAVIVYGAWILLGPPDRHGLLVIFILLFSIGRLLFFTGYSHGAPARALGFGLTFYPSVALLIGVLPAAVSQLMTA